MYCADSWFLTQHELERVGEIVRRECARCPSDRINVQFGYRTTAGVGQMVPLIIDKGWRDHRQGRIGLVRAINWLPKTPMSAPVYGYGALLPIRT